MDQMRVLAPLSDALSLIRDSENKVFSTIQMVLSIYINKGSVCAFCYAYIELRMYAKRPESRREG